MANHDLDDDLASLAREVREAMEALLNQDRDIADGVKEVFELIKMVTDRVSDHGSRLAEAEHRIAELEQRISLESS